MKNNTEDIYLFIFQVESGHYVCHVKYNGNFYAINDAPNPICLSNEESDHQQRGRNNIGPEKGEIFIYRRC